MGPEDLWMIILTAIYVAATIGLFVLSRNTLVESKKQFESSMELQRQHNYDSVRPAVTIDFKTFHEPDSFNGSITINNHGLGTAVLKELRFTRNGKAYKNNNGYCTIYDLISSRFSEEKVNNIIETIFHQYYTKEFRNLINDKDYLAVNEKLVLMEFKTHNNEESELVEKIFDNVQMELVYTDIYNSNDWTVTKSLSYFKPFL